MATLRQRLERTYKTTSIRFLRANLRLKRAFSRRAACLFVTAMPKTASTFLVKSLADVTGYIQFFLGYDHLNEQDLYLPKLIDSYAMNVVCHQHTRATKRNLELIREFRIRPVVLVRDLRDVAVSLHDHLRNDSRLVPIFYAGERYFDLSREAQLDAIVELAVPWLVQFYAGWQEASRSGEIETLWLDYEEVAREPASAIRRVLSFYRLDRFADRIDAALARGPRSEGLRFNVGVSGRGGEVLTPAQQARIAALTRFYPGVDWGRVLP